MEPEFGPNITQMWDAQMAEIIFQTRSEARRQQKFFLRHIPNPNDQEVTQ